jgi:hypothetical protein
VNYIPKDFWCYPLENKLNVYYAPRLASKPLLLWGSFLSPLSDQLNPMECFDQTCPSRIDIIIAVLCLPVPTAEACSVLLALGIPVTWRL